jgi:hypothetical protein
MITIGTENKTKINLLIDQWVIGAASATSYLNGLGSVVSCSKNTKKAAGWMGGQVKCTIAPMFLIPLVINARVRFLL